MTIGGSSQDVGYGPMSDIGAEQISGPEGYDMENTFIQDEGSTSDVQMSDDGSNINEGM